jgi:membrane protein YdbS with pleckstrin-like domain
MQQCSHGFPRSLGIVNDLFAPPGSDWRPVSPALPRLRRAVLTGVTVVLLVALVILALVLGLPGWVPVVMLVVAGCVFAAAWVLVGRNARWWGYAERNEELFIRHGALFRTLVVVPYGRMQYVDVQSGPLARLCGIASVHLHTASPGTSARIPGLPAEEAARLRDRLTSLGEAQAAGL